MTEAGYQIHEDDWLIFSPLKPDFYSAIKFVFKKGIILNFMQTIFPFKHCHEQRNLQWETIARVFYDSCTLWQTHNNAQKQMWNATSRQRRTPNTPPESLRDIFTRAKVCQIRQQSHKNQSKLKNCCTTNCFTINPNNCKRIQTSHRNNTNLTQAEN